MPNRIIKESICTSDNIDLLSPFAETVFYRLMVNCDDFGRFDARPKILSSRLFPLKNDMQEQIENALDELVKAELITLYMVDGKLYLHMNSWEKHQSTRAKKSKYPSPDDSDCQNVKTSASNCKQIQSDENNCKQMPPYSNSETNSLFGNDIRERDTETGVGETTDRGFGGEWDNLVQTETKKPKRSAKKELDLDDVLDRREITGELRDAYKAFIEMRNADAKKKIRTSHTLELIINRVNELGTDDKSKIAILEQSTRKGWMDVFEVKEIKTEFSKTINSVDDVAKIQHRNPWAEMAQGGEGA